MIGETLKRESYSSLVFPPPRRTRPEPGTPSARRSASRSTAKFPPEGRQVGQQGKGSKARIRHRAMGRRIRRRRALGPVLAAGGRHLLLCRSFSPSNSPAAGQPGDGGAVPDGFVVRSQARRPRQPDLSARHVRRLSERAIRQRVGRQQFCSCMPRIHLPGYYSNVSSTSHNRTDDVLLYKIDLTCGDQNPPSTGCGNLGCTTEKPGASSNETAWRTFAIPREIARGSPAT